MEEEVEPQYESIKITLLGSSGVGKTCIIRRYTENNYEEGSQSTSGASYSQKYLEINNRTVQIDLWDTAGQEKYRSLGRHFYKDAYIVVLVYDITNKESFIDLKDKWYNDLKNFGEKYTVLAVVGSKSDIFEKEEVPEEDAREFAKSVGAIFMLTSAKTGDNIEALFDKLVRQYLGPEFLRKVSQIRLDRGDVQKVTHKKASKYHKKKKKC
jgi:small GTP-binding protein